MSLPPTSVLTATVPNVARGSRLIIEAACTTCGPLDGQSGGLALVLAAREHTEVTGHIVVLNGTTDIADNIEEKDSTSSCSPSRDARDHGLTDQYPGASVPSNCDYRLRTSERLETELDSAEKKAFDALARYKFTMFGYWSGVWVHLNRISGNRRPNPFRDLVKVARFRPNGRISSSDHALPSTTRPNVARPYRSHRRGGGQESHDNPGTTES
jgi:hypothetical protein